MFVNLANYVIVPVMLIDAPAPTLVGRPYQLRAVEAVITAWESDPRVCLALPTGSGKTVVAALLIQQAAADGMRVAFLTDRLTLIPQTRRMFESAGLTCAVIQGDRTSSEADQGKANVLICSAQTLEARGILPDDIGVGLVIVDECHIDRAIVQRWLDLGVCMCGLTATPLARWMPEKWRALISPVTTREAIDDAWLLEPFFRAEIFDIEKDVSEYIGTPVGPGGDWSDDQAAQIMAPHLDAVVTAWQRVVALPAAEGGFDGHAPQTIVQAATVDHAEALTQRFNKATGSMGWGTVSYRMSQTESDAHVNAFRAGHMHGLISVAKLTVGFDAPAAACLVSARPTRRLLPWVQLVGRIMRTGSKTATVVDCTGNAARFAARLHRFWAAGAVWPLPESPNASPSPPTPDEGVPRYPCPDHPEIVHPPNAQVCQVCFRPLQEVEPPDTAKVWKDGVTAAELGRAVRLLASQRVIAGGADKAEKWARVQVKSLTGTWPRRDWPGEIDPADPFHVERPHPVVAKLVKMNTKAWIQWKETPEAERSPEAPVETIHLTEKVAR